MKKLLLLLPALWLALSSLAQTQGTAIRATNGVAFGTLTVQGHIEATNAGSTNIVTGSLIQGANNLGFVPGTGSHSEGQLTRAKGAYSHAEGGIGTTANGSYSHAEGTGTYAGGDQSHASGYQTYSLGQSSEAHGVHGVADASNSYIWFGPTNADVTGVWDTNGVSGSYQVNAPRGIKLLAGEVLVGGHINATNAADTNTFSGRFQQGTSIASGGSSAAFGAGSVASGNGSFALGQGNHNAGVGAIVAGRSNTITSSSLGSSVSGFGNQSLGQNALVSGEANQADGQDTIVLGKSLVLQTGDDNDFVAGRNILVGTDVINSFIWNSDPGGFSVAASVSNSFLVNTPASGSVVFSGAPVQSSGGFIGPFYGSNLVGSYVGVSGASPYVVSNLWSVVLPDGATAFQLGNPGAGYANVFATNFLVTADGIHYTIFTQGTNTLFGGDVFVTNGVYHGKSFRPQLVAATIVGATAQSTNLMEIQDGSSNVLASVTASGVFTGNGAGLTNVLYSSALRVGTTPFSFAHVAGLDNFTNSLILGDGGRNLSTNSPWGQDGLSFTTNDAANNNTFVGWQAGVYNGSGLGNTFVGYQSGYSNLNGVQNTFVGWNAGYANSNGYHDTYIGVGAGQSSATNNYNVFVGTDAGLEATNANKSVIVGASAGGVSMGDNNTLMGYGAGTSLKGHDNVGVGFNALQAAQGIQNVAIANSSVVIGDDNIMLGYQAGPAISGTVTGIVAIGKGALIAQQINNNSVAIGRVTLNQATNSANDVAIGYQAGMSLKNSSANVAIGINALSSAVSASDNTAVGAAALANASGSANVALGEYAGNGVGAGTEITAIGYQTFFNGAGIGNTALGYRAGLGLNGSGTYNTFLGDTSDTTSGAVANSIAIGHGTVVTNSNQTVIGNSSTTQTVLYGTVVANSVGIGTASPAAKLDVNGGAFVQSLTITNSTFPSDNATTNGQTMGQIWYGGTSSNAHTFFGNLYKVNRSFVMAHGVVLADTTVTNTSTATTNTVIYTVPMAANYLTVGKVLEPQLDGVIWQNSNVGTFPTLQAWINQTNLLLTIPLLNSTSITAGPWQANFRFTVRAIGNSAQLMGKCLEVQSSSSGGVSTSGLDSIVTPVTFDSTVNNTITITVSNSVAGGGGNCSVRLQEGRTVCIDSVPKLPGE